MAIFDLPLKARLRLQLAGTSQPIGMITLLLILICYREPMGADSILTLELMPGISACPGLVGRWQFIYSCPSSASLSVCPLCVLSVPQHTWLPQTEPREIDTDSRIHYLTELNLFDLQPTPVSSELA